VCTVYARPLERVLFDQVRDANPFFHLLEALWMLAGRNDVAWLVRFNKRMATYSDDGATFNAAYGYRWRKQFNLKAADGKPATDQLQVIADLLRRDPDTRRAVLQIWDAEADLGVPSKDLACNTQAMFKVRDGKLNMLVSNRSNDMIWGCYGANAVHFSFLQEYVAAQAGVSVGVYRQMSDSFHVYADTWPKVSDIAARYAGDPYATGDVSVYPLVSHSETFDSELERWMASAPERASLVQCDAEGAGSWRNPYFPLVATPVNNAWFAYKAKDYAAAAQWLERCAASDWRRACREWLLRRETARAAGPSV
jgi:thymidylate synthase